MVGSRNKASLLIPFQENLLLSVCPSGSTVVTAEYFRKEYLPGPVRVVARLPDGSERTLVLRLARHGSIEEEARLLPVLHQFGVPVPQVLAGPETDPDSPDGSVAAVYSFLEGCDLQELSETSSDGCIRAIRLVVEGALRLAAVTQKLQSDPRASFLRTETLSGKLDLVLKNGSPWLGESVFRNAVDALRPVMNGVTDPPVFSGGDCQPANFLTDGDNLTGFVDFENALYQDLLFGFAKYPIYDLHPMNKAGFVQHLLDRTGSEPWQFDIRVALCCLITLQREIPVRGESDDYRDHVLDLLANALRSIAGRRQC